MLIGEYNVKSLVDEINKQLEEKGELDKVYAEQIVYDYGVDKTNTFAIEINSEFKGIPLEDVSKEQRDEIKAKGVIYTSIGYIIENPNNPDDFIEYRKKRVISGIKHKIYL